MNTLTGLMRFQLTLIWMKSYKGEMSQEDYIKKVCKAKGITYTAPKPVER